MWLVGPISGSCLFELHSSYSIVRSSRLRVLLWRLFAFDFYARLLLAPCSNDGGAEALRRARAALVVAVALLEDEEAEDHAPQLAGQLALGEAPASSSMPS